MAVAEPIMFSPNRLVFIGLGGIGSWIVEPVCRYFRGICHTVVLVDGDGIENRNLERQSFAANEVSSYKANALTQRMRLLFSGWTISAYPNYVTKANVQQVVRNGDAVFVSPDNHEARRVVAAEAKRLANVAVFTAGNELYEGSCHVYLRLCDVEMSRDFMQRHPEAVDMDGGQREGCGAAIDRGAVQLIAVNFLMAALVMVGVHMVFKYGSPMTTEEAWAGVPQELYGSINGRMRTTMVVQSAMKEARCSS